MKLTTQQINALTSKIYNEIKQEVKEHNEALQTEKEFLNWKLKNPKYKHLIEEANDTILSTIECDNLESIIESIIETIKKKYI